jgi:hypothetical protein
MAGDWSLAREPWYRRPDFWLLVGAILVPFGWVPALCRVAWAYAAAQRDRRRGETTDLGHELPRTTSNQSP